MAFAVPFSSSPPSTPDSRHYGLNNNRNVSTMSDQVSTTPAGPPPSSAPSFTPAGQPPSTFFGSSQFGTGLGKLKFDQTVGHSPRLSDTLQSPEENRSFNPIPRTKNGTPARPSSSRQFRVPSSSLSQSHTSPGFAKDSLNLLIEPEEYSDDALEEGEPIDDTLMSNNEPGKPGFQGFTSSQAGNGQSIFQSSTFSRKSAKALRSSKGKSSGRKQPSSSRPSQLPSKGDDHVILNIARDMAKRLQPAQINESDDTILGTEKIMSQIYERVHNDRSPQSELPGILAVKSADLLLLWDKSTKTYDEEPSGVREALELVSLWLNLHHPPLNINESSVIQRFNASVSSTSPYHPIPKLLLDWLDKYHTSTEETLRPIRTTRPNCTAHELFWETVNALALRGKLKDIIRLFQVADFKYAASALDDGQDQPGYHGAQLQSVQGAVNRARQMLEMCPAVRHADWRTDSVEWENYRDHVASELEQLVDDAEGADAEAEESESLFVSQNFNGNGKSSNTIRQRARQAMSRIPWHVYESLKVLHKILLGSATEILAIAQDYLEASFALTVWWDGVEDDKIRNWSLTVSRQSAFPDGTDPGEQQPNLSANDGPFQRRLKAAFLCATDPNIEGSFAVDTLKISEVGLSAIVQNDAMGMLGIVRSMSLVVCSALAELGVYGGWMPKSPEATTGLDNDDLMVLSYGQPSNPLSKDDILIQYVDSLFSREDVETTGDHKEGWELAIAVATRMDDRQKAHGTIQNLLEQLHLVSQDRMDKLLALCTELNLTDHAMRVSERFADHLTSTTTLYGPALLSYARAHSIPKLSHLLSLLTSYSLVQTAAYPPSSALDPALSSLLAHPRPLLANIQRTTPYGAGILQFHISGYATLRWFYDLRDGDSEDARTIRPLARRRAAAKHLVAVINSAADSIYGGLYDASRRSAVEVDGLLTLFGEATALISSKASGRTDKQPQPRVYTIEHLYALLSAIEDLSTVNSRVFSACEECLNATVRNYRGLSKPPSPHAMLKKSVSSGTGSNFSFSLMGSEMVGSQRTQRTKSGGSSGVLVQRENSNPKEGNGEGEGEVEVEVQRGWDWRAMFDADVNANARASARTDGRSGSGSGSGEEPITGMEVLRRLRVGVVRELADAEVEGDGWVGS